MKGRQTLTALALAGGLAVGVHAQQSGASKPQPKAPLVSVVGCASRTPDGKWALTKATETSATEQLFSSSKEIEAAKNKELGKNRYGLVGTADFGTKEDLLKHQQRGEFTRPEVANATGQLQNGQRVVVKGLLITAGPNDKRLNLVSVLQLGDPCKP